MTWCAAGKGRDYIAEGLGNDLISGGPGKDYLTYIFFDGSIRIKDAQEAFGAGHDVLAAIETIEGTAQADVMRGSQGDDDLRGGGGDDRIYGLGGADVIFIYGGIANGGPGIDYIQATGRSYRERWSRQRPDRSRQGSGHRVGRSRGRPVQGDRPRLHRVRGRPR